MFHRKLKLIAGALVACGTVMSLHAQMAQDPLLSRTAAVEPNIVLMFDDSGSMISTAIYQFGGALQPAIPLLTPADNRLRHMPAQHIQYQFPPRYLRNQQRKLYMPHPNLR